ncbi:C-type mannose receptor 2 [Genypterus blacodes]|uniref:C-type mannose receptor 2 n=1 Tax=Genypterus blacodes TaxID=154954 RepID=UPI003F760092
MDDMKALVDILSGLETNSWIGLWKGGRDRMMWSDGSGVPQFTRWREGEPNYDYLEMCVESYADGEWNDNMCGVTQHFVCYERRSGYERYVFYYDKQTWVSAQDICRSRHTDLVTISNRADNSEVNVLLLKEQAWIGLFRDSWAWSDESETSFRFWLQGWPASKPENCVFIMASQQGRWRDARCDEEATFVCQGDLKVKKIVIRMKMKISNVDITNATVFDALLEKLMASVADQTVSDFKLTWRADKRGHKFHRQEHRGVKEEAQISDEHRDTMKLG